MTIAPGYFYRKRGYFLTADGSGPYMLDNAGNATLMGTALSPLRFATNSSFAPSATQSLTTTRLYQVSRRAFWLGSGDMSQLVLSFLNWTIGTGGVTLVGNSFTIVKASLEKDGGSYTPITFGGSRSKVIAAGDTDIQCDAISPSAFSLTKFTRDEKYWLRILVQVPAAGNVLPKGQGYNGSRGGTFPTWVGYAFDPTENTTVPDVDGTGTIGTGNGIFNNNVNPIPYVVLGRFKTGDPATWLGIGDSIMDTSNDTLTNVGFAGYFARAMTNDTFTANFVGGMDFGVSGGLAALWSGTNIAKATAYWKYAKYATEEFGTNNFAVSAQSLATMQGQQTTLWTQMLGISGGPTKILRSKLLPRTTSTDTFLTEANQTAVAGGFVAGGNADLANQWFDTLVGTTLASTVSFTTLLGVDPWKWVVDGVTPSYATSDGTHPAPAMHAFMATTLRAAMASGTYP
jgi:lysophospholipase L1-like esterase